MPQIAVYLKEEQYKKLLEAGNKSEVVQKALNQYWGVCN